MPLEYIEPNVSVFLVCFQQVYILFYVSFFISVFPLRFISLLSTSAFVIKFAFANLAAKSSAVNVLNFGVVIYL